MNIIYEHLFLEPEWAIDLEAMRARGIIIVLVKSNKLVKNIENKKKLPVGQIWEQSDVT